MSKILICVPSTEQVAAEFCQSLSMATANLVAAEHTVNVAFNISSYLAKNRRELVEYFLSTDYEYIWWVDSDMKFPADACVRLLEHKVPIIGCNYRKRRFPNPIFTSHRAASKEKSVIDEGVCVELNDDSPPTELVDIMGHGCLLVSRKVYEDVGSPYYIIDYDKNKKLEIGEDIYFCQNARAKNYEIVCDNNLSKEISHIGVFHFKYNLYS